MNKIIKDDLSYLLFAELYLRFSEPKAKRKAFAILEAAIHCFEKKGFSAVTLAMVAREAGVTRPLIRHYFKDLKELREICLKYIRLLVQKHAVESLMKGTNEADGFAQYLRAHFRWVERSKVHARVWLAFLSSCSLREADRQFNTRAVSAGTDRLCELLKKGQASGVFKKQNEYEAARLIQTLLKGGLIAYSTEDMADPKSFEDWLVQECLSLAQG